MFVPPKPFKIAAAGDEVSHRHDMGNYNSKSLIAG